MRKEFVKAISICLALTMILVLAACGKSSTPTASTNPSSSTPQATEEATTATPIAQEPVTLKLYAQYSVDDEKGSLDYAIEALKKELPNVTLDIEPFVSSDVLKVRASTGDLPDIMAADPGLVSVFSKNNEILNLKDYADVKSAFLDKLAPGVIPNIEDKDGNLYALSTGGNLWHLWFYNKEIFAQNGVKVPTNNDELTAAVKAFTAKNIVPIAMYGQAAWSIGSYMDSFVLRTNPGGLIELATGKSKASDPQNKDAITRAAELIKLGAFQKGSTSTTYDQARELFHSGKAAMLIVGDWEIPDGVKALGDKLDFMPYYPTALAGKEEENKNQLVAFGGGGGYAVSAKTKNKDLAVKVAAMLAYYQGEGRYVRQGHTDVNINTDGLKTEKPLDPVTEKLIKLKRDYIYHAHTVFADPKFATPFGEQLQSLVAGEPLTDFFAKVDKLSPAQ
ncbi:ABC transporter substrate-binding protein [Cohnella silvisoli]|uniref:Extracellular solute-binding protein n=1 Tax=Cohnella silvisoli TaxID=2873699 RepID=A0ABV1KVR3_9BACL|nr:extracellular solute-binding protein [Cohnella silvisoli]MCD9023536.1 extracellular solute-binding protein [Cohnella silvisoli]